MITAALSVLGVLVGAALQYGFGRQLEHRKQLIAQKAQSYIDFFKAVAGIRTVEGNAKEVRENNSLAAESKTRICIYGSVDVITKLAAFQRAGATTFEAKGQDALVDLLIAMREDIRNHKQVIEKSDLHLIIFGEHL